MVLVVAFVVVSIGVFTEKVQESRLEFLMNLNSLENNMKYFSNKTIGVNHARSTPPPPKDTFFFSHKTLDL